jgi:DNA-binding response OmpR family regulator
MLPELSDNTLENTESLMCPSEVNILVIDDEPEICELIRTALNMPNFAIDTVCQVNKIESQLQAKAYHLVLLDYVLPGLSPETTFKWITRHQPDASVIVISGFPSIDAVVTCLRERAYDYLTKPLAISPLLGVVHRCLESKGLMRLSEEVLRESLGATVRKHRKDLGMTLAQVAERTKLSLGYLSQIELGKNSASTETLYRICLGLGIKMTDLFSSVGTRSNSSAGLIL